MPVFEYRAVDSTGTLVNGTLLSADLGAAAAELQDKGLQIEHLNIAKWDEPPVVSVGLSPAAQPGAQPVDASVAGALESIRQGEILPPMHSEGARQEFPSGINGVSIGPPVEARSKVMTEVVGPLFNRAPLSSLLFFFKQLATMLHAGVGMVQTLDTLGGQTADPRLKHVILELRGHADAGRPISAGLQRYPEMFSPMMLSLVRVGEQGGFLDKSCRQIAEYIEREIELRNLIRRVTIYPKLVIAAAILIVLATNFIIASIGKKGGIDSILTRPATWIILAPIIVGIYLFVKVGLHNPRIRYSWDEMTLKIPLLGKTIGQLAMAKFGRAFGAMYAGGVHVPEAVKLAADACGNEFMRSRIHPISAQLEEGAGLANSFRNAAVFSPIVLDMISTGEHTGDVDLMLTKVSEFYEDEGRTKSMQFAYAFGVLVLLLVGIYVAYTVITFYVGHFSGIGQALGEQ